MKESWFDF